ncbi:MAG: hypothetical protein ACFFCS_10310, partial [Candidatus Hodarchaeota archaeon]
QVPANIDFYPRTFKCFITLKKHRKRLEKSTMVDSIKSINLTKLKSIFSFFQGFIVVLIFPSRFNTSCHPVCAGRFPSGKYFMLNV